MGQKKNSQSIQYVFQNALCTGCGTCAGVCPVSAIEIKKQSRIYLPEIDYSKCKYKTGCNLCYELCPGHSVDLKKMSVNLFPNTEEDIYIGRFTQCYTGYATDFDIRYHSASGGLITQLLIFLLENNAINGAVVTCMSKNYPLEPEVFIATKKEEVIQASSSKYCPVPLNIALKEIRNRKGKFAVVGLPCHIHGFRKAEARFTDLKNKIHLYLGIFCSSNSNFQATEYLLRNYMIDRNSIKSLSYRDEGWFGNLVVRLKNNKIKRYPFRNYYSKLRSFFIPERCTLCVDHCAELADISFGDIYIPEYWSDKIGTSSIITRSYRGESVIALTTKKGYIATEKISKELIIKSQWGSLQRKKYHTTMRISLFKLFGRDYPHYDYVKPCITFRNQVRCFFSSIILYAEISIGKRKYLWWIIKYLHIMANRLKRFCLLTGDSRKYNGISKKKDRQ